MPTNSTIVPNGGVPAHLLALGIGVAAASTVLYGLGLQPLAALTAAAGLVAIGILWWPSPQRKQTIKADQDDCGHVINPERYFANKEDIDITAEEYQLYESRPEGNPNGGETAANSDTDETERIHAD